MRELWGASGPSPAEKEHVLEEFDAEYVRTKVDAIARKMKRTRILMIVTALVGVAWAALVFARIAGDTDVVMGVMELAVLGFVFAYAFVARRREEKKLLMYYLLDVLNAGSAPPAETAASPRVRPPSVSVTPGESVS